MNTMMNTKHCPMCKEVVVSDATATLTCAVCAMPVDEKKSITTQNNGNTVYFCNEECLQIYEGYDGDRETALKAHLRPDRKLSVKETSFYALPRHKVQKKACCR